MNQRDIEQISAYLDGQLKPSDSARLESRLASDPALASTLDAMRASRSLLRRLPKRRAPRNFTLTRKMVGLKPPLPRSYPVFKFATAFAAFLFALSFIRLPSMAFGAAAPMPNAAVEADVVATESLMMESALAATEAPVEAYATEPPALAPLPTEMANVPPSDANPEGEITRVAEDPAAKNTEDAASHQPAPPLIANWQIALGLVALLGVAVMLLLRFVAARRWK